MALHRSCADFWILGEEIADFLTWWILEKTRKWRPKDDGVVVGRAEFSQVSCVLRVCQLCKCSCPDEIRLVMAEAPGDRIQKCPASSDDSCLNLTRLDWTRPDWIGPDEVTPEDPRRISDDFRVDCELCRHWGLSRRTGAKQNCAGGVEERRGRSRFFAGAKQNGAGAKQNGGGEEEGVSWGCI
ncbi:hypothetical protein Bbelb_067200 [Branchiostoma belcheri]|nr:hypothetical protein Bbelb_067200 [Branchiostoma belcheri]